MTKTEIQLNGPDLASRKTAAVVRHKILGELSRGRSVDLDLSGVISVSESYADELFGVLAAVKGVDWLASNVHLERVSEPVLRTIAIVVQRRLKHDRNMALTA